VSETFVQPAACKANAIDDLDLTDLGREKIRRREMLFDALSICRGSLPASKRRHIASLIDRESHEYGFDPLFVQAIVEVESMCLPTARSYKGAVGLIQLMPGTAREVAAELGVKWKGIGMLNDPAVSLEFGLHYLNQLEERFGDRKLAVAAYNMGPNRVARMSPARARKVGYVRKVLSRYENLREAHGLG
jgi:soluble lytic murein transglycosylase-like protein